MNNNNICILTIQQFVLWYKFIYLSNSGSISGHSSKLAHYPVIIKSLKQS